MALTCKHGQLYSTRVENHQVALSLQASYVRKIIWIYEHARPNEFDEATRELFERITKARETFQNFSAPPRRVRVSLKPSDIVFDREVELGLTWIAKKAILQVFHIKTRFNPAIFLSYWSVEPV